VNNVLQARDREIIILQSEVVELQDEKTELQALYVHTLSFLCAYLTMINYSLSEARATAKLLPQNSKKAKKSVIEESCNMGEAQERCDFLQIELGKMSKECEDTWIFSLVSFHYLGTDETYL
jgi:hypothetical protein